MTAILPMTHFISFARTLLLTAAATLVMAAPVAAQVPTYRVLATTRTSTMQQEMREAGASGFRFVAAMGGDTAVGGREVVVLMAKAPGETTRYDYLLLATNRTSTLQKELRQAGEDGYVVVGQTVFSSTFGGREAAALLERPAEASERMRYEYRLLATNRTSTLQRELEQAASDGFVAMGMTVGQTALGGNELVVITWRKKE